MSRLPLNGVTILDFTWQIAGPIATKTLMELGARVIRVESSAKIDGMRILPPHPPEFQDLNHSGGIHVVNSCKESISINLKMPGAIGAVQDLLPAADVVISNFAPGVMEKLGFSFDDVRQLNPRVVYITMPAVGSTGPKRHWRALGVNVAAIVGLTYLTGFPDDPPQSAGVVYPDFAANPFHAAVAAIAGLTTVRDQGEGVWIDLGQYESTAVLVGPHVLAEGVSGVATPRMGNRHQWMVPQGVFPTRGVDKWIALSVASDREWEALVSVLDLPDRLEWRSFIGRTRDQDRLEEAVAERTKEFHGHDLMSRLQAAGVRAGVAQTLDDVVERDVYLSTSFMHTREKDGIEYRVPGPAFRSDQWDPPVGLLSDMGADTERILRDVGGLDSTEIDRLRASGAIDH